MCRDNSRIRERMPNISSMLSFVATMKWFDFIFVFFVLLVSNKMIKCQLNLESAQTRTKTLLLMYDEEKTRFEYYVLV